MVSQTLTSLHCTTWEINIEGNSVSFPCGYTRNNKNHNVTENSAAGFVDVDATLLKSNVPCIAQPLCYVRNLSLSEGIFPAQLKIANVLPLYKADDSMFLNN